MSPEKPAVLLMAYGSPNSLDEVGEYLAQVRGGRRPTLVEVDRLKRRYEQVGGKTPLLEITLAQARALEKNLRSKGLDVPVFVGMKHWHPFIADTVGEIVASGVTSIVGIALAPHYSRLSIGGYEDAVKKALGGSRAGFTMVKSWHREKGLIASLGRRVRDGLGTLGNSEKAAVLFTAHSLPKAAVATADPYQSQLLETCRLVAQSVPLGSWTFAFQSAGEPREGWLRPQILEELDRLHREDAKEVLVCPVGFVADHLEILYDLDIEARSYARSLGMKFERTASLNIDPEFIDALAGLAVSSFWAKAPAVA